MRMRKGFTLVELLVVIAILAILSTLGVANFRTARIKARDLSRKSDLQAVAKSLEAYVNDHRAYPTSTSAGEIGCNPACPWGSPMTDGQSTYMPALPDDAVSNLSYRYSSSGASYTLYAHLENPDDPNIDDSIAGIECGTLDCNYKITSSNIQ